MGTLVNEEKPAGIYEVEFSVGQNSILSLSNGIYFYRLKTGSYFQTRKIVPFSCDTNLHLSSLSFVTSARFIVSILYLLYGARLFI